MLTAMTTADSPAFTSPCFFQRPTLHQPHFKMKNTEPDWESPISEEEMSELLEKLDLEYCEVADEDFKTDPNWVLPDPECLSKRSSKHLSGGGLLPLCIFKSSETSSSSQLSGGVVVTNPPGQSSASEVRTSRNPFRNETMKKVLDAEAEEEACAFAATNPFSIFHESSLNEEEDSVSHQRQRSFSSSSTRPASPTSCAEAFHRIPNPKSFIFALPAPPTANQSTQTILDGSSDLQCLQRTIRDLRVSGWYYENSNWQESALKLHESEPGTFLVRNSSDPHFLFTLSVQTLRGPTSVRLHYIESRFRLDAETKMVAGMPSFESVLDLIEYYIANTEATKRKNKRKKLSTVPHEQVWVDNNGQVYSHIVLCKPLRRRENAPSLQHLSRLAVNRELRRTYRTNSKLSRSKSLENRTSVPMISLISSLDLPPSIDTYLKEYPYSR